MLLAPNPARSSKLCRILSAAVNLFYVIQKHLETPQSILYISVQEFFPYEVVNTFFVN